MKKKRGKITYKTNYKAPGAFWGLKVYQNMYSDVLFWCFKSVYDLYTFNRGAQLISIECVVKNFFGTKTGQGTGFRVEIFPSLHYLDICSAL